MRRFLVLTALCAALVAPTVPLASASSSHSETLTVAGQRVKVYTNVPLAGSTTVDRAVVVIHGTGRTAQAYRDRMVSAAKKAGVGGRTAVLAPYFDDSWSNDAWKAGGNSSRGVSSYAVADALLALLADKAKFPNVTRVVLAGHSAGGQFTQRYAAVGQRTVDAYAVMNPSSYVYLDQWRPASTKNCAQSYDRWKYGLAKRSGYVAALTNQQVIARYTSRSVTVFNGGDDVAADSDLDVSCPANAQGKRRLDRGKAYSDYIRAHFPAAHHSYLVVPRVGHDSGAMFADPKTWPTLFGVAVA